MQGIGNRGWLAGVTLLVALLIAGCAAKRGPVPVEDRGTMTSAPAAVPSAPGVPLITTDASGKPLPGIENYGKPGYYAVRPGDTIRPHRHRNRPELAEHRPLEQSRQSRPDRSRAGAARDSAGGRHREHDGTGLGNRDDRRQRRGDAAGYAGCRRAVFSRCSGPCGRGERGCQADAADRHRFTFRAGRSSFGR